MWHFERICHTDDVAWTAVSVFYIYIIYLCVWHSVTWWRLEWYRRYRWSWVHVQVWMACNGRDLLMSLHHRQIHTTRSEKAVKEFKLQRKSMSTAICWLSVQLDAAKRQSWKWTSVTMSFEGQSAVLWAIVVTVRQTDRLEWLALTAVQHS